MNLPILHNRKKRNENTELVKTTDHVNMHHIMSYNIKDFMTKSFLLKNKYICHRVFTTRSLILNNGKVFNNKEF